MSIPTHSPRVVSPSQFDRRTALKGVTLGARATQRLKPSR